ncbi:MAG: hypothetical protein GOVbin3661_43 [Prokaryotic dsDNA virus sp.]|nr:MAG: hypothetical protein GOVbin3661_43 [Prokaryotic dsDNA virus sp.]|tara:strand:- start:699 stop:881 length:183 start_codon:yes stop_codon:yes gene_type:complete
MKRNRIKRRERQKRALERLKAQIESGVKSKSTETPLNDTDKKRISKEILNLEGKLKGSTV